MAAASGEGLEDRVLAFYCAIARQCFINEFVFSNTENESSGAAVTYGVGGANLNITGVGSYTAFSFAGNVFLAKAGILSGKFYVQAIALYATAFVMAIMGKLPGPNFGLILLGFVLAVSFFAPGLKYYRQLHDNAK